MTSFADIVRQVCVLAGEDPTSDPMSGLPHLRAIRQYIRHTAEEVCASMDFPFLVRDFEAVVQAGSCVVELPQDFKRSVAGSAVYVLGDSFLVLASQQAIWATSEGLPAAYCINGQNVTFDRYSMQDAIFKMKYLSTHYAVGADGTRKSTIAEGDDVLVLPDIHTKSVVWGAYALYRGNFKPDGKYQTARDTYTKYLQELKHSFLKRDGAGPEFVLGQ